MSPPAPTVVAVIASLRGTVLEAMGSLLVVEVAGVGYAVTVTPEHALSVRLGEVVLLHTAMVVREDDISLFGFQTREQLAVFDLLRGVTGVGPKSAMGVLAVMPPAAVATAVTMEDDAAFRRVSGIGPKTAKLIVVSLDGQARSTSARPRPSPRRAAPTCSSPSSGLGYAERAAQAALDDVLAERPDERQTAVLLRAALAALGPQTVR